MKHSLISIIVIAFISVPCMAQWKSDGGNEQAIAYGVHDTSFFASSPGHVERANPNGEADAGMDFTQGNFTTFASIGTIFFAGSGPPSQGVGSLTTNNGTSWTTVVGGPVGTNGTYVFAQYATRIARSTDSGQNWEHLSYPAGNSYAGNGACVYTNTPNNGLWRSLDSGGTWSEISSSVNGYMATLGPLLFVISNGTIMESSDSGSQWNLVPVDTAGAPQTVTELVTDGKNLFAGTMKGVYVSTDIGMTWRVENDGLQPNALWVTAMGIWDTLLYIDITYGTGPFEYAEYYRPIRDMTDTAKDLVQIVPALDSIEIYPNPANGMVTILAGGTPVLYVSVLNMLGETVTGSGNLASGTGATTLDLSKEPSGTYFLRIQTTASSVLKKITLER